MWYYLSYLGVIITITLLSGETTATSSLNFYDCSDIHYITEDDKYYIKWNGEAVNPNCKVKFWASGRSRNKYKICIDGVTWNLNSNIVYLKYYTSSQSSLYYQQKQYPRRGSLLTPTDESWCAENGDYVGIQLDIKHKENYGGNIFLVVYTKEVDSSKIDVSIFGGVIGGIVIISIIIVVIACCRRRKNARTARTNSTSGATVLVSQTAQQMQGSWNTGYSTPQNYGNGMSNPSIGGTTGGESFNPPPYSSIIHNQHTQCYNPPPYSSINESQQIQK